MTTYQTYRCGTCGANWTVVRWPEGASFCDMLGKYFDEHGNEIAAAGMLKEKQI
jgi:hypothetical protein